jgi:hypothetical protein
MAQVPTGTTLAIASVYAAAKATTIVTNAAEAVVTSATHGYSSGDILEVTSGWGRLNKRHFRIKSVTTDTFVLEGADTSNTQFFPAGVGIGSVRKVTTFQQILKILGINTSGGEPKTVPYKYMESDVEFNINDGFSAQQMSIDIDADAIGDAGYTALKSLTDVQSDTCLKVQSRNGALIFQPCTVALNEAVQMQDGQVNRVVCAINGNNRLTRYAA